MKAFIFAIIAIVVIVIIVDMFFAQAAMSAELISKTGSVRSY